MFDLSWLATAPADELLAADVPAWITTASQLSSPVGIGVFLIAILSGKLIPAARAKEEIRIMEARISDLKETTASQLTEVKASAAQVIQIQRETIEEQTTQLADQDNQIRALMVIGGTLDKVLHALPQLPRPGGDPG